MSNDLNYLVEYHLIPGYSAYGITREGEVVNFQTKEILTGSTNPDGYHNFRLKSDSGYTLTWGRHRLLGYVFINPGVAIDGLVINHKNGIKGDDRLENLEWVTYQGNAEHAGDVGLTEKCQPISVRNVDTGEVTDYPSIIECARVCGMSKDAVNYRVKAGEARVFPERKQYRIRDLKAPWCVPDDIDRALALNSTSKGALLRNVITGEVIEFTQLGQLANYLGISAPAVTLWINQPDQPVLPGFVQIKKITDSSPWREIGDPYLEVARYTGKQPVRIKNTLTGEVMIFASSIDCARAMNLKPTALNYRLKSRGSKTYLDGHTYDYHS